MKFNRLIIENVGPISKLVFEFPKNGERPKPLLIVGENGSGKSILLSHLVNALVAAKQAVYVDVEVEKGKVFKYRSPLYIKAGEYYSYSVVEFDSNQKHEELEVATNKNKFEEKLKYCPPYKVWGEIPENEHSFYGSTFGSNLDEARMVFKDQCCLYFPVNRFEEPAWLNSENLKFKANYSDHKRLSGYSNRNLICTSPLKRNVNWLLDVVLDRQAFDIQTSKLDFPAKEGQTSKKVEAFLGYSGPSATIYEAINSILKIILRVEGSIRLGIGTRHNRQISIIKDEEHWISNLFQLSTGEMQLVNLFLSIIRDYDLSGGELNDLSDIKGIVIIDEIDSHLHTSHQREILPELIKVFPNVQFVVTTHAPLFLIGMEEQFGENGFEIINMPNGDKVSSNDFSEFIAAYDAFKETAKHRAEILKSLEQLAKPIVIVEGDYDIRYLNKAAEILNKKDLLERVELKDGDGFGNLNKFWKACNNPVSEILPNKVILLYDCDTKIQNAENNRVFKRVIPEVMQNPISIGIENLFPASTIERVEITNPHFIDLHPSSTTRIRGEVREIPAIKSVNKDEKGNMCNWLCEHGEVQDFDFFGPVFMMIEEIVNS